MKKMDIRLVEGEFRNPLKEPICLPEQMHEIFSTLKDKASETLVVAYLMDDMTGIYDVHSTGTSTWSVFNQRDLFGRAYATRARYMILIHNHPSGDPTPSPQDLENLALIAKFAEPLNDERVLGLMDFIIVGDDGYWSWYEENGGGQYIDGPFPLDEMKQ